MIFNCALRAAGPLALAVGLVACADSSNNAPAPALDAFGANDRFDVAISGLSADEDAAFTTGDGLFDLSLFPYDGLGPLYTRASCGQCHTDGVRGPGLVQKMVAVGADGVTPLADQSAFPYGHTVHPLVAGGGKTPVMPPAGMSDVKVTTRLGPPILGRGYMEAIADDEILRVESEQAARADAIHGHANRVTYASQPNPDTRFHSHQPGDAVIGRFGLKARIAAVDDFTADALQGDMGITSPLRPTEISNPDGLTDDFKPGVDVTIDSVNARAMYVRLTAIPKRPATPDAHAMQLFADTQCAACHVPSLKTRADYPIAALAGIDAPVYTDLLLHDLGDELADGIIEGDATARDWRTAPLIGLRFNKSFMHDGRAQTIDEAIRAHAGTGSEANDSVSRYAALSDDDRAALDAFVGAL
ncbi:MAG TPA: di-heme oxidoredictase family protein [Polyangia bacterium]|nr:di-heme oxidoredictase family protein [Polyangia bacterium]